MLALGLAVLPTQAAPPPNILIILTDDQGGADYSAYGTTDLRTPNLDRLFAEGIGFENFYANCCVCSPTRAALLTGCYPDRVGVPGVIRTRPEDSWGFLSPKFALLPALLQAADYHTAIIGKWHLGLTSPNTPNQRGFEFFHGFLGDMMDDYWTHRRHGQNYMRRNTEIIDPEGHATDLFTDWACTYLSERSEQDEPFFLYLAYNAPHSPIQPPPEWLEQVQNRDPNLPGRRAKLVAFIEHLDHGIGEVLDTLDREGLAENTLVIFTSDNGGQLGLGANNGAWRSGKGHVYEGGLRVPFAARWPGQIAPGSHTDNPAITMDLFPTVLEAAGLTLPEGLDGVSLLPTLLGKTSTSPTPNRLFYFVRREGGPAYQGKTIDAIRVGPWKLLQDSPFAPLELYHVVRDPAETENLATTERKQFDHLAKALRHRLQVAGATPWQPPPR